MRILVEVGNRVVAGENHPAAIDLEFDELGVGLLQQHVIADLAAALVGKLQVVVVVDELQARAPRCLAYVVGKFGGSLGLIETHAGFQSVLGGIGHK